MTDTNWWDSHDNIVTLAEWMADNNWSAHDLAGMIEKPWKYTDEWMQARAELVADGILIAEAVRAITPDRADTDRWGIEDD